MPRTAQHGKQWRHMWELFHQAVEREECEREAFLEEACAGDRELRRQVGKLLGSHDTDEGLLDRPLLIGLDPAEEVAPLGPADTADEESAATLEPGELLADRFEIVRLKRGDRHLFPRERPETSAAAAANPTTSRNPPPD